MGRTRQVPQRDNNKASATLCLGWASHNFRSNPRKSRSPEREFTSEKLEKVGAAPRSMSRAAALSKDASCAAEPRGNSSGKLVPLSSLVSPVAFVCSSNWTLIDVDHQFRWCRALIFNRNQCCVCLFLVYGRIIGQARRQSSWSDWVNSSDSLGKRTKLLTFFQNETQFAVDYSDSFREWA